MYQILTKNTISQKGLSKLPEKDFLISEDLADPDGILVRSADLHGYAMQDSLLAIARAGAGTNNIPVEDCSAKGIVVFNTPGANANAVKELVIAALLLSSRKITEGAGWVRTLTDQPDLDKKVEAGKKNFVGPEIAGKTLGVVGLGAIGVLVANAALSLGMDVIGYDPYLSVRSAWQISGQVRLAASLEELVSQSDYVTLHVPLNSATEGTVNQALLAKFKNGARLINLARGGLVVSRDVADALKAGILSRYVTDFADGMLMGMEAVITFPHLGASTPESEENCAVMAALQLRDYLEFGNIRNSVNYPNCEAPYTPGKARVTILHRNIPNMVGSITTLFAKEGLNIDNMINKSRGEYAYTIIDFDSIGDKRDAFLADLSQVNGIIKARIIREQ
ncbi:MAG: phosphoglycerate dehydrogenase [Firmicutes bacterium]|nr:phosphoglycerate dehydrogenase [Bacillota bacterium]